MDEKRINYILKKIKLIFRTVFWNGEIIMTVKHRSYQPTECETVDAFWEEIMQFVKTLSLCKNPALCMLGIVAENVHMFEQQMLRCRLAMICGCYSKTLEVRFALFI